LKKSFGWRRIAAFAAPVTLVSGGVILAISQHWIPPSALASLLYTLPCAALLLVCMRGARGHTQSDTTAPGHPPGSRAPALSSAS
jgi:hypothetical protein